MLTHLRDRQRNTSFILEVLESHGGFLSQGKDLVRPQVWEDPPGIVITNLFGWPWVSRYLSLSFLTYWVSTAVLIDTRSWSILSLALCMSCYDDRAAGG